ncbi:MAG: RNA polymerase sigma factor SigZ [Bacteroidota bacterium]
MNPPPPTSELLYRTFQERLRRFILKRVHDSAAADDILQDVFLKIHTRADTLQDETKLESWIFQITRNTIIDHYRSQGKTDTLDSSIDPAEEDPHDEAHQRLATTVRSFIDQLPPLYRDALVLVEYEGMSQSEAAARLGISLSGAKSRVQRARAMLRDLLMQCCHFEFDQYGTVLDYHSRSCSCCAQENRPENNAKDCC